MAIAFDGDNMTPMPDIEGYFQNWMLYSRNMDKVWYGGSCNLVGCSIDVYDFARQHFATDERTKYLAYDWAHERLSLGAGMGPVVQYGLNVSPNG